MRWLHVRLSNSGLSSQRTDGGRAAKVDEKSRASYMAGRRTLASPRQARSEAACPRASRNFATRPACRALIGSSLRSERHGLEESAARSTNTF